MLACRKLIFAVQIAVSLSMSVAWSQESRASVIGRVTDASGAVVPAAAISLTNIDTGVTVRTLSNAEGNYFSSFLIPGNYRIEVEKAGFKKLVQSRVTLSVNDRVELNLTLEAGMQAESVTVTENASLLDSANVPVGRVVATQAWRSLPTHPRGVDDVTRLG